MTHIAPFSLPIYKKGHYPNQYVCEAELMTSTDVCKMIVGGHINPKELEAILLIDPENNVVIDKTESVATLVFVHYLVREIKPDPDTMVWLDQHGQDIDELEFN